MDMTVGRPVPSIRDRLFSWRTYLVFSLVMICAYLVARGHGLAQSSLFCLISLLSVVAMVVGLRTNRVGHRRVWRLLLAGDVLYFIGNILWYSLPVGFRVQLPYPGPADGFFLSSYATTAVALFLLVAHRTRGSDRTGIVDSLIVTFGLGGLSWVFLIGPAMRLSGLGGLERVVTAAYPFMDIVLLAALVRLLLLPGEKSPAYRFLLAGVLCQLAAGSYYSLSSLNGTFSFDDPFLIGYALFFVMLGATCLHPSIKDLSKTRGEPSEAVGSRRMVFLAFAALIPPVIILIPSIGVKDTSILAALSIVEFSLVLFRLYGLMVDVHEYKRLERLKDEFVSVVSHELRTPLTSIRGSLGLLGGGVYGPLSAKGTRMVEIAVENTDRLVRLINDILDIDRMESGKATLHLEACDAGRLMTQGIETVQAMARNADVELQVTPHEAPVWADPDRIVQTLSNLISNAIKFSPPGATVSLGAHAQNGEVIFSVKDRGRGIPEDKLDSIFGRFQQVDATDSRQKGGTGLGLAICKSIVEHHDGRIWVQSREGVGSTFSFALPVATRSEAEVEQKAPDMGRPRVLVCDDDPSVLEVVPAILRRRGYEVLTAGTGREAIKLAESRRPHVILLDLIMPDESGWEVATKLKSRPATEAIPIVVLSVLDSDTEWVSEDVSGWVDKPIDEDSLFGTLEKAIWRGERPTRVLVVEDDSGLAGILAETFEQRGLEAHRASTTLEAVRQIDRLTPDLLVLDLMLSDGDGVAVIEWLREQGRLGEMPIVVYTAKDLDDHELGRLKSSGALVHLKGRVTPEELEHAIARLLAGAIAPQGTGLRRG